MGKTRPEVVSKIINSFHPVKPIVAVQFLGYDAKVTFASEAHKREVMANESVSIEGVECSVRGGGPRPQNVLVYNFPYEIPHAVVREALSAFGEVESVHFRHWTHARGICDGVRTVRMIRSCAISRNLVIDGFPVKVSYPGQALECDICGESGHIARNCELRGKCLECRQPGHFQRNCPARLRRLQRSTDSLDAVPVVSGAPPVALSPGAGPPPVVFSGVPPIAPLPDEVVDDPDEESSSVDVHDNQLDELASQSVLANVSAPAPSGTFGTEIGSTQPSAEPQIPNLSADIAASDVSNGNDSLVTVSEGEIASNDSDSSEHSLMISNVANSPAKEGISDSNVIVNDNTSESNVESTSTIKDNSSSTMHSNVNVNTSEISVVNSGTNLVSPGSSLNFVSISEVNSGTNLVSPGSSLNSVSLPGGAVPLSSVGCSDSAVRVSNVPSGLRAPKGPSSGVSKPAAARPSGLRPGLRKAIAEWSWSAKRKR